MYHTRICTTSGTDRKNQMYHHAAAFSSGDFDRRKIASTAPSANPTMPAITVSCSVSTSDSSTDGARKYSANTFHCHCGLVASDQRNCRITKATTTEAIQRPQCLTGTTFRPWSTAGAADAASTAPVGEASAVDDAAVAAASARPWLVAVVATAGGPAAAGPAGWAVARLMRRLLR